MWTSLLYFVHIHILVATTPPPTNVATNAPQAKPTKTAQPPIQPPAQTPPTSSDAKPKKEERNYCVSLFDLIFLAEQPFNRANPTIQYSQFTRNVSQQQQTLQQALVSFTFL